jgi:ZIP family zinc transporter
MNGTAITLGAIAGVTIYLGLPIAFLRNLSQRTQGFLTAMSTGILVFLLVEITSKVIDSIEDLTMSSLSGFPRWGDTAFYSFLFAAGLFVGLMGLVWFEKLFIAKAPDVQLSPAQAARRVSMMIAMGIGLHNFSEGLAIGQAYSWGNTQLAWLLVIGFALHNATEGFGIVGPLGGQQVSWKFLGAMGLLGGGPTLLGSVIGSFWTIKPVEVFFLSMASGSILYVVGELLHLGRKLKDDTVASSGLLAGFFLAFVTELLIAAASGGVRGS